VNTVLELWAGRAQPGGRSSGGQEAADQVRHPDQPAPHSRSHRRPDRTPRRPREGRREAVWDRQGSGAPYTSGYGVSS